MAISFKHLPKGSLIGSGAVKFRHYGEETSTGETWVLNETLEYLQFTHNIDFTSNNESFTEIHFNNGTLGYGDLDVYDRESWTNSAYRTVTFSTAPSGDLLTWLQANGVKQKTAQSEYSITLRTPHYANSETDRYCKFYRNGMLLDISEYKDTSVSYEQYIVPLYGGDVIHIKNIYEGSRLTYGSTTIGYTNSYGTFIVTNENITFTGDVDSDYSTDLYIIFNSPQ